MVIFEQVTITYLLYVVYGFGVCIVEILMAQRSYVVFSIILVKLIAHIYLNVRCGFGLIDSSTVLVCTYKTFYLNNMIPF